MPDGPTPARINSSAMARKRGAPVLIELLRNRQTRPGDGPPTPPIPAGRSPASPHAPHTAAPHNPSRSEAGLFALRHPPEPSDLEPLPFVPPAAVEPKSPIAESTGATMDSALGRGVAPELHRAWFTYPAWLEDRGVSPQILGFGAAVLVLVGILAYVLGFQFGRSADDRQYARQLATDAPTPPGPIGGSSAGAPSGDARSSSAGNTPAGAGNTPSGNNPAGNTPAGPQAVPPPGPAPVPPVVPAPAAPTKASVADLRDGYNYLHVATMARREDINECRDFLLSKQIESVVIEPEGGRGQFKLLILQGYPRETFRAAEDERAELAGRIQRLGRLWKAENKLAPTDFGAIGWVKYSK